MNRHTSWRGADGFTLLELLITVSVLGILAGISIVGFTRNWRDERLKGASRATAAWLDEARRLAVQKATPCRVSVNRSAGQLSLEPNPLNATEFCAASDLSPLTMASAVQNGKDIRLCSASMESLDPTQTSLNCSSAQSGSDSLVFTPRGTATTGLLIQVNLPEASAERCVAVMAPMGQIRSGRVTNGSCDFTKAF